jgi:hypothetical protein
MTGHTFVARWELDAEGLDMPLRMLRREALCGPLQELLDETGAELLCEPEEMAWRVDSAKGELVASGPARARVEVAA